MSLLPIIYTSLFLFFGILLIVIAVSYLLFKARKRTNPLIQQEILNQQNLVKSQIHRQQAQNNYNTVPQVVPVYDIYSNSIQQNSNRQPTKLDNSERNQYTDQNNYTGYKNNYTKEDYRENINRETKANYISKPRITNSRIEILNISNKFKTNQEEKFNEKPIKRTQSDLYEYNLLNFYSDKPIDGDNTVHSKPAYGR